MSATTSCIYQINIGEFFYVGRANDFRRRRQRHLRFLRTGTHINHKMQTAFQELNKFRIKILAMGPVEDLEIEEQKFLDELCDSPMCLNISRSASTGHESLTRKKTKQSSETE